MRRVFWSLPPFLGALFLPLGQPIAIAQTYPETASEHLPPLVNAQQSLAFISRDRAYRYATPIELYPGRSVMIDFRTDEVITFIQLSDLSEIVYQTNAPLESGQAKLIVLRQIHELDFESQTEAAIPNLVVSTVDRTGTQRSYTFNLVPLREQPLSDDVNGIAIVPAVEAEAERVADRRTQSGVPAQTVAVETLQTQFGAGTLEDFVTGLDTAIALDYTPADDPIVAVARAVIARAEAGMPFRQAITATGFPLDVAIALCEIGTEQQILGDAEADPEALEAIEVPQQDLQLDDADNAWNDAEI